MIYERSQAGDAVRQGDIFFGVPRIEISLQKMLVYKNGSVSLSNWEEISALSDQTIIAPIRPVIGIVASQDCDCVRAPNIMFCEIRAFQEVEKKCKETKEPKSWKGIITQQARLNQKWFYLAPDETLGFARKMAVDFQVMFLVPRIELEARLMLRRGRLNDLAEAHFRERIGEFFRRYPYDEWYPLDNKEMDAYSKEYPEARRFPWQPPAADPKP